MVLHVPHSRSDKLKKTDLFEALESEAAFEYCIQLHDLQHQGNACFTARTSVISKCNSFPIETSSAVSSPAFAEKRRNFVRRGKQQEQKKTTADMHYRF